MFFLCVAWKLCGEKYWGGAGGGETARALAQVVLLRVVVVVRLVAAAALAALVRALFCVRLFFACWCDAACASSHEADGARSAEEGERAREDKEEEEHGDDKRDDEVEATEAPQDEVRSVGIVATAAPKTALNIASSVMDGESGRGLQVRFCSEEDEEKDADGDASSKHEVCVRSSWPCGNARPSFPCVIV